MCCKVKKKEVEKETREGRFTIIFRLYFPVQLTRDALRRMLPQYI